MTLNGSISTVVGWIDGGDCEVMEMLNRGPADGVNIVGYR